MIFATGFAPFRGGPMHYARTRGAADIRGDARRGWRSDIRRSLPARSGLGRPEMMRRRGGPLTSTMPTSSPTPLSSGSARTSCWRCRSVSARPTTSPMRSIARAAADRSIQLRIFTALTLGAAAAESRSRAAFHGAVRGAAVRGLSRPRLCDRACTPAACRRNIEVNEFFFQAGTMARRRRRAAELHLARTTPMRCAIVLDRGVNVVAQLVAQARATTARSASA